MQGVAGVAWALTKKLETSGCTGPLKIPYMLLYLHESWQVDQPSFQRITQLSLVSDMTGDTRYIKMNEVLYSITEKVENLAVTYLVGIPEVPDANIMYQLYHPCTVMVFFQNKYM